jgi:hypothetical protein
MLYSQQQTFICAVPYGTMWRYAVLVGALRERFNAVSNSIFIHNYIYVVYWLEKVDRVQLFVTRDKHALPEWLAHTLSDPGAFPRTRGWLHHRFRRSAARVLSAYAPGRSKNLRIQHHLAVLSSHIVPGHRVEVAA